MSVFTRRMPDGFHLSADSILGSYSGIGGTSCVILGSGPSAQDTNDELLSVEEVWSSVTYFAINNGGEASEKQIEPNLWTSYDPCDRFPQHFFLDPRVVKFVRKDRQYECIHGEDIEAHECPNVYFFENEEKDYGNFFGFGGINDSKDSMLQAIDIAIRLGFKKIYLSGADMHVKLSAPQEDYIKSYLPEFRQCDTENSLWETIDGVLRSEKFLDGRDEMHQSADFILSVLEGMESEDVYSFGTCKLRKAVMCDHHYRVCATQLRKARRCLDKLGVEVYLLRPSNDHYGSRLSSVFPTRYVNDLPYYDKPYDQDYDKYKGRTIRQDRPYAKPVVKEAQAGAEEKQIPA